MAAPEIIEYLGSGFKDKGIVLVGRMNRKSHFFIPSKRNFFGGWQVEAVMINNGYNSILLPLAKGNLKELQARFSFPTYSWTIAHSKGIQAKSLVLTIKGPKIPIFLCEDLLGPSSLIVDSLRFHLCTEDAKELLTLFPLLNQQKEEINKFLDGNQNEIPRRTYAVLGQSVLGSLTSIQHGTAFFLVDQTTFRLEFGWSFLQGLSQLVATQPEETFPDRFQDLGDEDHEFGEETYVGEYED